MVMLACPSWSSVVDYEDDFVTAAAPFNASDCNCTLQEHMYNEICSCDYPEELPATISESLPLGLVYSFVFLLGTIGNSLVIFVVSRYKRMRSVTNVFLASLSTADLCLILFCVPIQYVKYLSYSWLMGPLFCYSLHYVQGFTMMCSVLTLSAMSVERYIAIVHPMKSVGLHSIGRAKKVVIVLWMVAAFLAVPNGYATHYQTIDTVRNRTAHWCTKDVGGDFRWFSIYQCVLVLALPSLTMIFCYTSITRILYFSDNQQQDPEHVSRGALALAVATTDTIAKDSPVVKIRASKAQKRMLRKSSKSTDAQTKKQVTQMLIAVVLLFILCWSPYIVDDFLVAFRIVCDEPITATLKYLRMTFAIMAYSNSCVNPMVYAFMSKNFRQTFRMAYQRCFLSRDEWNRQYGQSTLYSSGRRKESGGASARNNTISAIKEYSRRHSSNGSFPSASRGMSFED